MLPTSLRSGQRSGEVLGMNVGDDAAWGLTMLLGWELNHKRQQKKENAERFRCCDNEY